MRCPQCSKRNSVAALACDDCGYRFKTKSVPFQAKFVLGGLAAFVLLWAVASVVIPQFTDSQEALTKAAKSLAAGPKSQADATQLSNEFDRALQDILKRFGTLKDSELTKKLQADLPTSFFEVHIFPLARNVKLVEVDNVLHVSDYLVWSKANETVVSAVSGLEVFDDGTTINDAAGKLLVLLGHTAAQTAHRPSVKALSFSGNQITDQTDKLVPKIPGEGTVSLGRNKQDIVAKLSLMSIGQAEGVFNAKQQEPALVEDETVPYSLQWQSGHYALQANCGKAQLSALYCLAKCLKDPANLNRYQTLLDPKAKKQFQAIDRSKLTDVNFVISAKTEGKTDKKQPGVNLVTYTLSNPKLVAKVELEKRSAGNRSWGVSAISVDTPDKVQEEQVATETPSKEPVAAEVPKETTPTTKESEKSKPEPVDTAEKSAPESQPSETASKVQTTEDNNSQNNQGEQEKTAATTASSAPSEISENPNDTPASASIRSSSNSVILRKGPGTTFGAIDEISKGAQIQVLGQEKSWYKVRANGKEGYVYAGLLEYKKPDGYTVATIKQGKRVTDEGNRQLASLQVGERLVILGGIKNNKYKVQLANGKVGFVDKDALDVTIDAPPLVP
jgi:SH3-like domain-containing protein